MRNAWRGMDENARLPYRREIQRLKANASRRKLAPATSMASPEKQRASLTTIGDSHEHVPQFA
jgi:hypothetical protein